MKARAIPHSGEHTSLDHSIARESPHRNVDFSPPLYRAPLPQYAPKRSQNAHCTALYRETKSFLTGRNRGTGSRSFAVLLAPPSRSLSAAVYKKTHSFPSKTRSVYRKTHSTPQSTSRPPASVSLRRQPLVAIFISSPPRRRNRTGLWSPGRRGGRGFR
jgi:hypothetical protein